MDTASSQNSPLGSEKPAMFGADEAAIRNVQQWIDHPSWDFADNTDLCEEDIEICLRLFQPSAGLPESTIAESFFSAASGPNSSGSDDGEETVSVSDPSKRFVFERLLGVGAFGIVLCVFDSTLSRRVALKILRPSLGHSKNLERRFLSEVQILQNPVRRLRSVCSSVPADLDNVVMKSLAREQGDRYATASEYAADLRRFLRGEPVVARRASFLRRFRFWTKCNPALSALSCLFAVVLPKFEPSVKTCARV